MSARDCQPVPSPEKGGGQVFVEYCFIFITPITVVEYRCNLSCVTLAGPQISRLKKEWGMLEGYCLKPLVSCFLPSFGQCASFSTGDMVLLVDETFHVQVVRT